MLHSNLSVNNKGNLCICGADCVELAKEFGTPLYVLDENYIRDRCHEYTESFKRYLPTGSMPLYASKALCIKAIYPILLEEDFGADVVSSGELYTALAAGFPAERVFFHGDNKLPEELDYAISKGVGCIVADNIDELKIIDMLASRHNVRQRVLLRLTPGIDPHTFDAVNTGTLNCQFGVAIETGQADVFVAEALKCKNIDVLGFHCHIGSQIFSPEPFTMALDIMLDFMVRIRESMGYTASILNLGGGYGIRYTEADPIMDIYGCIEKTGEHLKMLCDRFDYPLPAIFKEPGRSIVADAGLTLYTAGYIKKVSDNTNFIIVDGGMADNPRYVLYASPYTIINVSRCEEKADQVYTIAGRSCETGDLIQENVPLPETRSGDLLAVLSTGAYNYSMSSNYNRFPKPPMIMLKDGRARVVVKKETFEDLIRNDL